MTEQESFLHFLRQIYGSFEGSLILSTAVMFTGLVAVIDIYSPTDLRTGVDHPTYNAWWIIVIVVGLWLHFVLYLAWREKRNAD